MLQFSAMGEEVDVVAASAGLGMLIEDEANSPSFAASICAMRSGLCRMGLGAILNGVVKSTSSASLKKLSSKPPLDRIFSCGSR